jgi:hypothetical protein
MMLSSPFAVRAGLVDVDTPATTLLALLYFMRKNQAAFVQVMKFD